MYAAVDCTDGRGAVLLYELNAVDDDWSHAWFLDADGLADWLDTWLAGAGWYEEDVMGSPDRPEPQPWARAKERVG